MTFFRVLQLMKFGQISNFHTGVFDWIPKLLPSNRKTFPICRRKSFDDSSSITTSKSEVLGKFRFQISLINLDVHYDF
jgi:hypothetical protein